jgi:hypothetical protein
LTSRATSSCKWIPDIFSSLIAILVACGRDPDRMVFLCTCILAQLTWLHATPIAHLRNHRYPTMVGIKCVNVRTNKLNRVIGSAETTRFTRIALYQGCVAPRHTTSHHVTPHHRSPPRFVLPRCHATTPRQCYVWVKSALQLRSTLGEAHLARTPLSVLALSDTTSHHVTPRHTTPHTAHPSVLVLSHTLR